MAKLFANSGDPDQTPRSAVSDLGLHCLPSTQVGVTSYIWHSGIVQMCVPNGPLFQRCQLYDWPHCFNKKYMTGPIF